MFFHFCRETIATPGSTFETKMDISAQDNMNIWFSFSTCLPSSPSSVMSLLHALMPLMASILCWCWQRWTICVFISQPRCKGKLQLQLLCHANNDSIRFLSGNKVARHSVWELFRVSGARMRAYQVWVRPRAQETRFLAANKRLFCCWFLFFGTHNANKGRDWLLSTETEVSIWPFWKTEAKIGPNSFLGSPWVTFCSYQNGIVILIICFWEPPMTSLRPDGASNAADFTFIAAYSRDYLGV